MKVVVASDIHGVTDELKAALSFLGSDTLFLSPWATDACPYQSEHEAVREFLAASGIEEYSAKIATAMGKSRTLLVGFSVGATGSWIAAANASCHTESQAVLYYGSRIRDHQSLQPKFDVSLVFAEHEHSFKPDELAVALRQAKVKQTVVRGASHGFMNPRSSNYAPQHACNQLELLEKLCNAYAPSINPQSK